MNLTNYKKNVQAILIADFNLTDVEISCLMEECRSEIEDDYLNDISDWKCAKNLADFAQPINQTT